MAYRKVYFRIRTECYSSGWSSDADRAAFKEESRRLFQELGWTVTLGRNGICKQPFWYCQELDLFTKEKPGPAKFVLGPGLKGKEF